MFSNEIKDKYPDFAENFSRIEFYDMKLFERFKSRLVSQKQKPLRGLGHNAMALLQKTITRLRYLLKGFDSSFNEGNSIMAFLAVRSYIETTGVLACLLKWLQKFYDSKCSYDELDNTLYRLFMGSKVFPDKSNERYSHLPNPYNALDLVDDIDTLFKKITGKRERPFKESYEFLSEFCHPNFLGISQGSTVHMPSGIAEFEYPPSINNDDANELLSRLPLLLWMSVELYDRCYELLKQNEELPILYD